MLIRLDTTSNLYEITYQFIYGYGETRTGVLVNTHPYTWIANNDTVVKLVAWQETELEHARGMDFVPERVETPIHIDLM